MKAIKEHAGAVTVVVLILATVAGLAWLGLRYARAQSNVDAYRSLVTAVNEWNEKADAVGDGSVKVTLTRREGEVESIRETFVDLENKSMWGTGVVERENGEPFTVKEVEYMCEFYDILVSTDEMWEHENCFNKDVIDGVDGGWYVSEVPDSAVGEILVTSFLPYLKKDYTIEAGWSDHWVWKGDTWENTVPLNGQSIKVVYTVSDDVFNVKVTRTGEGKAEPYSTTEYSRTLVPEEFDFREPEQYSEYPLTELDVSEMSELSGSS